MRQHVRRIGRQHADAAVGDLLLAGDLLRHQHRRLAVRLVLHLVQAVHYFDDTGRRRRRDDLPCAERRGRPQLRLHTADDERHRKCGPATHHLLGKQLARPVLRAARLAHGLGHVPDARDDAVRHVGDGAADAVEHCHRLQRLLLARPAACARARRQLLPCLKAVAQLLVVAEAEAQVLQQRLHEGRGAKAGRANAALGRLAHLVLQRQVEVHELAVAGQRWRQLSARLDRRFHERQDLV
mmetsp:Transcript_25666/g.75969  ORF Transcript_25666/g.75969 Transcript_25666/m.75969 type:complete len:240 (-) Transcript_25666:2457-3176(-)